jgi:DNA-binding CsgD family transcriptional regulator
VSRGGLGRIAPPEATLREPLSRAETRVLRYLPTGLSVAEIAGQLYLSKNTVRTHMRHVYAKLDAHRRQEAVERARALGLLASSTRQPCLGAARGPAPCGARLPRYGRARHGSSTASASPSRP